MQKFFTDREIEYVQRKNWAADSLAGFFCAKEAFFKAIGTGLLFERFHDVEIKHDSRGAPFYHLSSRLIQEQRLHTSKIHLSISHTKDIAVAVCIVVHFDAYI